MHQDTPSKRELLLEMESLKGRLGEAEETLRAIRSGETDAIVVSGPQANKVFALESAGGALATVQRILHMPGGPVCAEVELNKGASFCFTLRQAVQASARPGSVVAV